MSNDKIAGGIGIFAVAGDQPEAKGFFSSVANVIVGRFPARPTFKLEDVKAKPSTRGVQLAAVGTINEDDDLPPDDPEYSDDLPDYKAVRRVYRQAVHAVLFWDEHGDWRSFTWTFHPEAQGIGQGAILLRFTTGLVLLEGRNLRQLYADYQQRRIAEFRVYRKIWAKPDEGQPVITRLTVIRNEAGGESVADAEQRLARELSGLEGEPRVQGHG